MASNNTKIEQGTRIEQRQIIDQVRFARMLEMNAQEFDESIDKEIEENPALEDAEVQDKDDSKTIYYPNAANQSPDEQWTPVIRDEDPSFYDILNAQLVDFNLPPHIREIAKYIIGNLDRDGYLRRPVASIVDDLAFNEGIDTDLKTVEEAWEVVKNLEPHGVGAADLQECLLLQLKHLPQSQVRDDAINIVRNHYDVFILLHSHTIKSRMKASRERVDNAMKLIKSLNPKPGSALGNEPDSIATPIIPDIQLVKDNGSMYLVINSRHPNLAVASSFEAASNTNDNNLRKRQKDETKIINYQCISARSFIHMVQRRNDTLLRVVGAILRLQKDYFESEDVRDLHPMKIKDIAAITGDDISVISRATNNKYLGTPWGTFPLRYFFSDAKGGEGSETTRPEIEDAIREIIDAEDKRHPLSDQDLMDELQNRGYLLKRRTVSKYRDELGIPISRLRKEY